MAKPDYKLWPLRTKVKMINCYEAETRSGKGVSCVVPILLTYPGSISVREVFDGKA